jgi:hypothetical protein
MEVSAKYGFPNIPTPKPLKPLRDRGGTSPIVNEI